MKWMKERDLLIAQTMAFVQSVSGKAPPADKTPAVDKAPETDNKPEAVNTVVAPAAPISVALPSAPQPTVALPSVERFEPVSPAALALPDIAFAPVQASPAAIAPAPLPEVQARTLQAPIIEVSPETPREIFSPVSFSRPDLREDFQSEIRARVARFRAHQERFNREREAYCAATMAKVHAVLNNGEAPPPRSGK